MPQPHFDPRAPGRWGFFYVLFSSSLFIFSRSSRAHLKVTTFLGVIVMGSPVWRFLPRRSCFSRIENLPKPEIWTSSPDSRVCLITSKTVSTSSVDLHFARSVLVETAWVRSALVRVPPAFFRAGPPSFLLRRVNMVVVLVWGFGLGPYPTVLNAKRQEELKAAGYRL